MQEYLAALTWQDYIYAALMAFIITSLLFKFRRIKVITGAEQAIKANPNSTDLASIVKRCKTMFPIETVWFNGQLFKSGTKVRITTLQKKVIEGELIGKNELNMLCVLTNKHIIAHEIEKISEMIDIADI